MNQATPIITGTLLAHNTFYLENYNTASHDFLEKVRRHNNTMTLLIQQNNAIYLASIAAKICDKCLRTEDVLSTRNDASDDTITSRRWEAVSHTCYKVNHNAQSTKVVSYK